MINGIIIRHLIFWILFLILWSVNDLNYHKDFLSNIQSNFYTFIPYAALVYFNLYYLVPRFLLKKRIVKYTFFLIISISAITFLSSKSLYFYFTILNISLPTAEFFDSFEGRLAIIIEIILSLALSMTLFLLNEWYQKERRMREIEQKQLETELNLLKSQINPHFLFNSLNSIYVMLGKNLNQGKDMLLQFSDILSHQLYETNKKRISLKKEFKNLTNYINIESIRHSDLASVNYVFPEDLNGLFISPMLLLPIVENAFKHGQSSSGYKIRIDAKILNHSMLEFDIINSIPGEPKKENLQNNKGIGLANVKRRLELIYPNKHKLNTLKEKSKFRVNLKIELDEE